jgi:hypothetical protein
MASAADGDRDLPWLILLVGGLLAGAIIVNLQTLQARVVAWSEIPLTAAGEAFAAVGRAPARGSSVAELVTQTTANGFIIGANRLRPFALIFVGLALGLAGYPKLSARAGAARDWPSGALYAAAAFTLLAGAGLALSTPAVWFRVVIFFCELLAALNVGAGLYFLLLAASRSSSTQRLQHGPAFAAPVVDGPAILIGQADADVLPGHARWIAQYGGKITLPFNRLSCGLTILGEKGSGKSRLLFAIHDDIRARYPDVPILIHDPKGEWYRTYYDENADLVFAPHYKGSAAWALWRDFQQVPELRHSLISSAVYAHPDSSGTFWMAQAIEMLEQACGFITFAESVRYLANIPRKHPDDKMLLSVFGTAKLGFLDLAKVELMAGAAVPARSIDEFIRWPGRIFLLNDPSCAAQQRGAFSLFLSAFLLRALSMPDVPAGTLRAVAIVDEALTFNLPPDVDRMIYALCRSKGLCIIAGAQRLPDTRQEERGEWQHSDFTISMKIVNQETQAALSRRAGSLIFKQTQVSTSVNNSGQSRTEGEHDSRLDAIPAEHFGRLSPRQFVLFHDQGLITGATVDVMRSQRDMALPAFDSRDDVRKVSMTLIGA